MRTSCHHVHPPPPPARRRRRARVSPARLRFVARRRRQACVGSSGRVVAAAAVAAHRVRLRRDCRRHRARRRHAPLPDRRASSVSARQFSCPAASHTSTALGLTVPPCLAFAELCLMSCTFPSLPIVSSPEHVSLPPLIDPRIPSFSRPAPNSYPFPRARLLRCLCRVFRHTPPARQAHPRLWQLPPRLPARP